MEYYDLHTVCHLGGRNHSLALAALRVLEVGEARVQSAGNGRGLEKLPCEAEDPLGALRRRSRAGGVSPLSLLTFFAAAKKVSAAPHRGDA